MYCDETRPRLKAPRSPRELAQQVAHEVIADNAAGYLMQRGEIDLVITGSDRTLGRTGGYAIKSAPTPKPSSPPATGFPLRRHSALND